MNFLFIYLTEFENTRKAQTYVLHAAIIQGPISFI